MQPGKKPISLDAHRKRGTHDTSRHGPKSDPDDPQRKISTKLPKMPTELLDENGRREWRRVIRIFREAEVFSERDRVGLTQYCLLWQELCKKRERFQAARHAQLRVLAESLGISTCGGERLRKK